jgi:patatin-like phospholipase/acyl hydrolase
MPNTYKILTIDGGGIRGIIPATILVSLEKMIQDKTGTNDKIGDYFDFIAGTSTGGILSCLYLAPEESAPQKARFTATDALNLYLEHGDKIFDRTLWKMIFSLGNLTDEKYSAVALEEQLLKYFGDLELAQLIKPCLITGYDVRLYRPVFFTKQDAHNARNNYFVRDVARATSAAPTYFQPALPESRDTIPNATPVIDGGVFANNPTACALVEAIEKGRSGSRVEMNDIVILSLGTGESQSTITYKECKDWGLAGWAKPLFGILMDGVSQSVDYQMKTLFTTLNKKDCYLRINGDFKDYKNNLDIQGLKTDMDCATPENIKLIHQFGRQLSENNTDILKNFVDMFF